MTKRLSENLAKLRKEQGLKQTDMALFFNKKTTKNLIVR